MTEVKANGKIIHVKGDRFFIEYTNVEINGTPVNWTGYTGVINIKATKNASANVKQITLNLSETGKITVDDDDDELQVNKTYYYDMVLTKDNKNDTWFNNETLKVV